MAKSREVQWSHPPLTIQSFFEAYKDRFPVIAMVTKGFHGNSEIDTLSSNQVS